MNKEHLVIKLLSTLYGKPLYPFEFKELVINQQTIEDCLDLGLIDCYESPLFGSDFELVYSLTEYGESFYMRILNLVSEVYP